MKVAEARELARRWIVEQAAAIPGLLGAYTAGSTNWLADDADLPQTSDFDVMLVIETSHHSRQRGKFLYHELLLEASYLRYDQLHSVEAVLGDYHLAPSLATGHVLLDPLGRLAELRTSVRRDYRQRQWVRQRCSQGRDKAVRHLRSIHELTLLHDQVTACLFGAGILTHVLLVAGLKNPTVRSRYAAVRELLAECDRLELHEALLASMGAAHLVRERVQYHLDTLKISFDAARETIRSPLPFTSDLTEIARSLAIEGSAALLDRGLPREALFWIAVTHSRCQKVFWEDGSAELSRFFASSYRDLLTDLGMASFDQIQQRCADIERLLPQVWDAAFELIEANAELKGE